MATNAEALAAGLDPLPWLHSRSGERVARLDSMEPGWIFLPRGGYRQSPVPYSSRGGLDPQPFLSLPPEPGMLIKGQTRWASPEDSPGGLL